MSRKLLTLSLLAAAFATAPLTTRAQDAEQAAADQRRAERRSQQAARSGDVAPASTGELSDTDKAELEKKLNDAKAQRDADLASAAQTEKDATKLEQKKAEIFSKFAVISTALRDQYLANGGTADTPAPAKAAPAKKSDASSNKKLDDLRKKLAVAEQKLSDEESRHTSKLADLKQDLKDATDGGKTKSIDKANKAIDKENTAYQAKKTDLTSQRDQLKSQIAGLGG